MKQKVKIKCFECGHDFLKFKSDIVRSEKINRPNFCSKECRLKNIRNGSQSDYYKNYKYAITKFCGSRQDEFSPFRRFTSISRKQDRIKLYGNPTITVQYLKRLWERQNGRCAYTNIKMILPRNTKEYITVHSLKKASLDRIDSSKGYIEGNVEFVCQGINYAKNSFTRKQMKEFIAEIGGDADIC